MTRTLLSKLAINLQARGVTLVRDKDRSGSLEFRILLSNMSEKVIATVSVDDLFDGDGNRFEDDLP